MSAEIEDYTNKVLMEAEVYNQKKSNWMFQPILIATGFACVIKLLVDIHDELKELTREKHPWER